MIRRLPDDNEEADRAEAALELGPEGAVVVIEPRSRDVLALVGSSEPIAGLNRVGPPFACSRLNSNISMSVAYSAAT